MRFNKKDLVTIMDAIVTARSTYMDQRVQFTGLKEDAQAYKEAVANEAKCQKVIDLILRKYHVE